MTRGILHLCAALVAVIVLAMPGTALAQCFVDQHFDWICEGTYTPGQTQAPPTGGGGAANQPYASGGAAQGAAYQQALGAASVGGSGEPVSGQTYQDAVELVKLREGSVTNANGEHVVYLDSLGKPTVGYGHLVTGADGLKVGDTITQAQADAYLQQDAQKAYNAALSQAQEAGINDSNFVATLTSTNYQLGTGWTQEHTKTWSKIKSGDYSGAAVEAQNSLWAQQTPTRVADLQKSLYALDANKQQQQQSLNYVP